LKEQRANRSQKILIGATADNIITEPNLCQTVVCIISSVLIDHKLLKTLKANRQVFNPAFWRFIISDSAGGKKIQTE
jgi:hypothetical protein